MDTRLSTDKPKIYLYCLLSRHWSPDVIGYALAEDGEMLASHVSSSPDWSRHDMGFISDWKHEAYFRKYPGGFDMVWLNEDELDRHPGFQLAWQRHKAMYESANGTGGG